MSGRTVRQRQPRLAAQVRREQALEAALGIIAEQGYAAVTMEGVARRMDVAKPVVYQAVGNRRSLLLALLEREEARAFEDLAAAVAQASVATDPVEALQGWATALVALVHERPASWRLLLMRPGDTPLEVRTKVEEGRDVVRGMLHSMLSLLPGHEAFDLDLAARAAVGAAEAIGAHAIDHPEEVTPERVGHFVRSLVSLFVPTQDTPA